MIRSLSSRAASRILRPGTPRLAAIFYGAAALTIWASTPPNPTQLVREVVENELRIAKMDTSLWRYTAEVQTDGKKELRDVVESRQGSLYHLLAVNGRQLSTEERRQDDARITSILNDKRLQRKLAKESQNDDEQMTRLFKLIPDAFLFEEAGRQGNLIRVRFNPNPRFHAPNHEAQVFHAMAGTMLLEPEQKRLVEISGVITKTVRFGAGILGSIYKGGYFDVRQTQVAPGFWEISAMNTQIAGRILFLKTISMHEVESRSKFQRLPDDLTLTQAGKMLLQSEPGQRASTSY